MPFVGGSGGPGSIIKKTGGIADAWYDAYMREDYDTLLSLFPDDLWQKVSRQQMQGVFSAYRQRLGALKSRKIHFAKENHSGGKDVYVLQYAAQYESGGSIDTFNIVSLPNEPPKLEKVEFDSPALKR